MECDKQTGRLGLNASDLFSIKYKYIFCSSFVGLDIVEEQLVVGSDGTLICTSELPNVTSIEWLDGGGQTVAFTTGAAPLNLTFTPVDDSLHGSTYTCRVNTSSGMSFNDSVELSVEGINSL